MHIEQMGAGEHAVVAVHGWAGTGRDFAAVARRLGPGCRLLAVDLPGCGRSAEPTEWSVDMLVDEVCGAVRASGACPVTLMGFCSGATICLLAAARLGDAVARVVAIDPLLELPWYFALFTWGEFGRRAYAATFASPVGRRITNAALQRRQRSDAGFTDAFENADHSVALRYLRVFRQSPGVEPLRQIAVPVTVCCGEHTFGAVKRSAAQIAAAVRDAEVYVLKGSGHLPLVRSASQIAGCVVGGRSACSAA